MAVPYIWHTTSVRCSGALMHFGLYDCVRAPSVSFTCWVVSLVAKSNEFSLHLLCTLKANDTDGLQSSVCQSLPTVCGLSTP